MTKFKNNLIWLSLLLISCDKMTVLNPAGDIASQQSNLLITATFIMLLIIVPVIFFTLFFAWKYRKSNTEKATYDPDWHHSTKLETMIWGVPILIILVLGTLTYIYTHKLDPFNPLERISAEKPLDENIKPLVIEVVSMDWKWLFIYPEKGFATINELAAPVDRPIHFKLTSVSTMNTFYIPDLAGMIYTMPGMQTELNAVINKEGEFHGLSAHYSGEGFSGMNFKFYGMNQETFNEWIFKAKSNGQMLTRDEYLKLVEPSIKHPKTSFAQVDKGLYDKILNRCAEYGKICMHHLAAIDKAGGEKYMRAMGLNIPLDICTVEEAEFISNMFAENENLSTSIARKN